jgi:subtilisin family serine protease
MALSPNTKTDWLGPLVSILLGVWISGTTLAIQASAVLVAAEPGAFLQRTDITAPQIYFGAAVVHALVLLVPLLPLALWWRAPRYRAAFRAWLGATLFLLLLAPTRLIPSTLPQLTMLAQMLLAFAFAWVLWLLTGRGSLVPRAASNAFALACACGSVLALPWLVWGALGSITDVIVGSAATFAIALAATRLITRVGLRELTRAVRETEVNTDASSSLPILRGRVVLFGGFVLGALLLVMGSAIGFDGASIWFLFPLAASGWLLMTLADVNVQTSRGWNDAALFVLIALLVAAPMLLLDPKVGILAAVLGDGELFMSAFLATVLIVVSAWWIGIAWLLLHQRLAQWRGARAAWVGAGAALGIGLLVYFFAGQPGLFGDQAFVILKNQADVSAARNIADYDARRVFVYNALTAHAVQTQKDLGATLDALRLHYTPYYLVNALQVEVDFPTAWLFLLRGDVDRVLPAPVMRPLGAKPPTARGVSTIVPDAPEWNLKLIGADRVWNELGVRGQGIVVGQSDSGVDGTHPELSAQYRGRDGRNDYNWLDPWFHTASPTDIGGHGTHTLGSILGKHVGVAPDAEWIGCVNLARNLGNAGLYLNCMQFMLAPFPQNGDALRDGAATRGAMVLNNSWGCPHVEGCDANALLPAVRALRDAGVFVVASAGNDGPGCSSVQDPISLYGDVFSVGAINRLGRLATFSSRGPVIADGSGRVKPDIVAPGVQVYSSLPEDTYGQESGTSMAGPHVVGVVALMWSANPKLIGKLEATEQILRETAQRVSVANEQIVCGDPKAHPNDLVGYGMVDAYAAVARALGEK